MRCQPAANRKACVDALARAELRGSLALKGRQVLGWLRWQPTDELPKLRAQGLEVDPVVGGVSLLCFAVAADCRRQGVARGLLRHSLARFRSAGFRAVHAYPSSDPEGGQWTGPQSLFAQLGFRLLRPGTPRATWQLRL